MHSSACKRHVHEGLVLAEARRQVLLHCWSAHPMLELCIKAPPAYTTVVILP